MRKSALAFLCVSLFFSSLHLAAKASEICTKYIDHDMKYFSLGSFKGLPDDRFQVEDLSQKKKELVEVSKKVDEAMKRKCFGDRRGYQLSQQDEVVLEQFSLLNQKRESLLAALDQARGYGGVAGMNTALEKIAASTQDEVNKLDVEIAKIDKKYSEIRNKINRKFTKEDEQELHKLKGKEHALLGSFLPYVNSLSLEIRSNSIETSCRGINFLKQDELENLPDKILNLKRKGKLPESDRWKRAVDDIKNSKSKLAAKKMLDFEAGHKMLFDANWYIKTHPTRPVWTSTSSEQTRSMLKGLQEEYERQKVLDRVFNEAVKPSYDQLLKDLEIARNEDAKKFATFEKLKKSYDDKKSLSRVTLSIALNGNKVVSHGMETQSPLNYDYNKKDVFYGPDCSIDKFLFNRHVYSDKTGCENIPKENINEVKELCQLYQIADKPVPVETAEPIRKKWGGR